jgi:hypothetical protein
LSQADLDNPAAAAAAAFTGHFLSDTYGYSYNHRRHLNMMATATATTMATTSNSMAAIDKLPTTFVPMQVEEEYSSDNLYDEDEDEDEESPLVIAEEEDSNSNSFPDTKSSQQPLTTKTYSRRVV